MTGEAPSSSATFGTFFSALAETDLVHPRGWLQDVADIVDRDCWEKLCDLPLTRSAIIHLAEAIQEEAVLDAERFTSPTVKSELAGHLNLMLIRMHELAHQYGLGVPMEDLDGRNHSERWLATACFASDVSIRALMAEDEVEPSADVA